MDELFTIGYSPHVFDTFLDILKKYNITAIADVRSSPYSQFKPEFNREQFNEFLKKHNISYVFIGDLCGARVEEPSCYINGKVDYSLLANNPNFLEGLERIKQGMKKYRVALMCAEKDPITCHRAILICRNLLASEIKIKHILSDGKVEEHKDSEQRLLKLFKLDHPELFRSEQQRLDDAYSRQGEKIAYETAESIAEYEEQ
ncbi:MAG: DUF488 domain-containing protein [Candidatus Electrothrix sp. LOE2]|jgi:uncharacterized protein (DUF488 family)|nr:DUF488 domain-containing protein [Candidatus Electrothrix sp. LOE2]